MLGGVVASVAYVTPLAAIYLVVLYVCRALDSSRAYRYFKFGFPALAVGHVLSVAAMFYLLPRRFLEYTDTSVTTDYAALFDYSLVAVLVTFGGMSALLLFLVVAELRRDDG